MPGKKESEKPNSAESVEQDLSWPLVSFEENGEVVAFEPAMNEVKRGKSLEEVLKKVQKDLNEKVQKDPTRVQIMKRLATMRVTSMKMRVSTPVKTAVKPGVEGA